VNLSPEDMMPETGRASRDFNEREFVAKQIARADGKHWDRLPSISALGLRDKFHYRHMATQALTAKRMWDAYRLYADTVGKTEEKAQ